MSWVAAMVLIAWAASGARAQMCFPQIAQLTGIGAVGGGYGNSVSVSSDGNTAIIGHVFDNSGVGAAYVFVRSVGTWAQQGPKLVPNGGAGSGDFGSSVSLSSDGNTAVIGAMDDNAGVGAAYVFVRSVGTWAQQGPNLIPTGDLGRFGSSVSVSSDGNTTVIGAPFDSGNIGAMYVFVRSGTSWAQQGPKLVPNGGAGPGEFGTAVSLSSDGNMAVIGAPFDGGTSSIGAAYVFIRAGGMWFQNGPKLVPTGGVGNGRFGTSVSLSSDGNTAAIGSALDSSSVGAAYVFVRSGGGWAQQGPKLVPNGGVGRFGSSVSVSSDGNTTVIGAPFDSNNIGAAYVFIRAGGMWFQNGPKLVLNGVTGTGAFGTAVSLSSDGDTTVIGANLGIGAALVFAVNPPVTFSQQPATAIVFTGGIASFAVAANSTIPLTYRWRRNGANLTDGPTGTGSTISGTATPTLTITSTALADNGGAFDCIATNTCASKQSNPAGLAVTNRCPADFNGGGLSVQDIFDFLAAWFAGCP